MRPKIAHVDLSGYVKSMADFPNADLVVMTQRHLMDGGASLQADNLATYISTIDCPADWQSHPPGCWEYDMGLAATKHRFWLSAADTPIRLRGKAPVVENWPGYFAMDITKPHYLMAVKRFLERRLRTEHLFLDWFDERYHLGSVHEYRPAHRGECMKAVSAFARAVLGPEALIFGNGDLYSTHLSGNFRENWGEGWNPQQSVDDLVSKTWRSHRFPHHTIIHGMTSGAADQAVAVSYLLQQHNAIETYVCITISSGSFGPPNIVVDYDVPQELLDLGNPSTVGPIKVDGWWQRTFEGGKLFCSDNSWYVS